MIPSFSIIIPLYNKSRTIVKTLDSVSNLKGADFEVVVVDDGSTDNGPELVSAYPSKRIKLCKKPNGGVSSARNFGAQNASNSWLIFLDADDILFPDSLLVFADLIERHPRDVIFVGNFMQKEKGQMITMYCKKEFISENPCRDIWLSRFYLRPGSFCCSSHAFKVSGGYDERMNYNEDFEFCFRLAKLFRVVVSPKVIMEYVTDENEGRIKVHPLVKNFAYYIPYTNLSDRYIRYKFYNALISSMDKYRAVGDVESANILLNIKNNKFGRLYPLFAWCYYQIWVNMRRWRIIKDKGIFSLVLKK